MEENKKVEKKVEDIISHHVYWAVGAGLIPVPLADIAAVTAVQLDMLKQVCTFYNVDYSEEKGKAWVGALVSSGLSSVLARMGSSALKVVPVVGSLVGAASMAIISGASTYALGNAFSNHFAKGGSLSDINKNTLEELYKNKLEEGKTFAKKLKDKYTKFLETPEGKEKERNMGRRLKDLEDMRKEKLISEVEYERARQKIIRDLMGEA